MTQKKRKATTPASIPASKGPLTKSGKLPVAGPSSFKEFTVILYMHICRKILLISTTKRFLFYLATIAIISLLGDLIPIHLPKTYFARKHNIFNQFFALYGWGWVLVSLGSYILLTSLTYCCGNRRKAQIHLYRLVHCTTWWYLCTSLFNLIEDKTGSCSMRIYHTKMLCKEGGGSWDGFDISGHVFLMVFNQLVIGEEMKSIRGWDRLPDVLFEENSDSSSKLSPDDVQVAKYNHETFTPYIRLNVAIITGLSIVWDIVLLSTTVYFHTMPQKVFAAIFAGIGWYIMYKIWYTRKNVWTPGLPGEGLIKYMPNDS